MKTRQRDKFSAVVWFCLAVPLISGQARAAELVVYVSPAGNNAWSGSLAEPNAEKSDGPVATPQRARDLVRSIRSKRGPKADAIRIRLRGGTYFLNQPLTLTPQDSGSKPAPVLWTAWQNERPILSGGQPLTEWTRATINGQQAWMAKLPAGATQSIHELWLDGKRLTPARWPKKGTLEVAGLSDAENHDNWTSGSNQFRFANDDLQPWPSAAGAEVTVCNRWVDSHLPIVSINEEDHVVHFTKRSVFILDAGDRYWVENVRECLKEPGEFYVDQAARAVYLIPAAGVDPNQAQVIVPHLAQVLRLEGDPAARKFIEYVTFHGVGFANAEWYFDRPTIAQESAAKLVSDEWAFKADPSRSGFMQAAIGVPAAIDGEGVRDCAFDACEVSHAGTYGIELSHGCQNNRIAGCRLTDLGAGGIKIGEVGVRDAIDEQTCANEISDCTIADGGNLFPSCIAIWIGQSHDNVIAHNDIHGFWYTGISVGWTWGYGPGSSQRNVIEYNHVHHIGMKSDGEPPILSDMGAIYTLGNQEGTVIRNNRFHDISGLKYGGWGIYFDEGTTHILAENNLVYRTTHGGFHQHYGKDNIFRNNIVAFGRDQQIQRSRLEDHSSFTFERNIVLWDQGGLLAGDWVKLNVAFDHNTYWHAGQGDIRLAGRTWEQWRQAGMDEHSKIADPHFANPEKGDFNLTPQSPESLAGFVPFDLSTVGPKSRDRE